MPDDHSVFESEIVALGVINEARKDLAAETLSSPDLLAYAAIHAAIGQ